MGANDFVVLCVGKVVCFWAFSRGRGRREGGSER
jgi:hypothetical protein